MTEKRGSARISVPEICERLGMGRRAVYGLLEAKVIPSIRVGSRWVIARHAYEEWEKSFGATQLRYTGEHDQKEKTRSARPDFVPHV